MTKKIILTICALGVAGLLFWFLPRNQPVPLKPTGTLADSDLGATTPETTSAPNVPENAALPSDTGPATQGVVLPPPPVQPVLQHTSLATVPTVQDFVPHRPDEIAATAGMYAAHAPLRTPEVADPDSKANRQVLQVMVAKALARAATPQATTIAKP